MNSVSEQKNFEKAIYQGSTELAKKSLSQGCNLSTPLPGGELPLHLAIRRNHPELTKLFLDKGANPTQKDLQRMQAIDHASFSNNPLHKAHILSFVTGHDVQKTQKQMQNNLLGADTKLKNKINRYKTAGLSLFSPILGKTVYQGNLREINKNNINTLDANGLAPIHYAILGNQVETFAKLIALGADIKILGPDQDSLLHFASLRNTHTDILKILLRFGLDPNAKNAQGQTPLHYASIEDNLAAIFILVKGGKANTDLVDSQGKTPFSLVGSFVTDRDPLKISSQDLFNPLLLSSMLLLPFALQKDWISPEGMNTTILAAQQYLPKAIIGYIGYQLFFPGPPQERTGIYSDGAIWEVLPFMAQMFFSDQLPSWCKTGLTIWNSYKLLRHMQQGLQTCYQNIGYRNPLQIGMKAFAHSFSLAPLTMQIAELIRPYYLPMKSYFLPSKNRILHQGFDATDPEEAGYILSPGFTLQNCKADLPKAKQFYRTLSLQYHPDKTSDPNAPSISERLNEAYTTLKGFCKDKKN